MNLGHVIVTVSAIDAILKEKDGTDRKLPFKLKYKLVKIKEMMDRELVVYEQERVRLINELGERVEKEDGAVTQEVKDAEQLEKFYKALEEILSVEPDLKYNRLTKDDLALVEDMELDISENQIQAFFNFLMEPEEDEK